MWWRKKRKPPRPMAGAEAEERAGQRLALAELVAGASAALTVLLALLLARVAGHVAGALQAAAEGRVQLHQRAGHAQLDRVRLAGEAAADDIHVHVVATGGLRELQRLPQDHLRRGAA